MAADAVAGDAHSRPEQALVKVAVGGIDVHCLHEVVRERAENRFGIMCQYDVAQHQRPPLHHGGLEEAVAVGQALADHETAVLVAVVGQVFLVARKHVEDGSQGVERQGGVAVEHGEQRGLSVVGEKVAVLLLD